LAFKGFHLRVLSRLLLSLAVLLLLALHFAALAKPGSDEVLKLLPREIGTFRQLGPIRLPQTLAQEELLGSQAGGQNKETDHFLGAEAEYISADGARLLVEVVRFSRDSDAYSLLTIAAKNLRNAADGESLKIRREIGTASASLPGRVAFFKGPTFVRVLETESAGKDPSSVTTLARLIADRLEQGEADVPVLVKHLPQWEHTQEHLVYLAGFNSLKGILSNQPILDSVSSEGDADAVVASYGSSQFVIVEFNTPQLAGDNDRNITAKIQELRSEGQPVPSAYRRVGNYSVFVFNAQSELAGNELIDQVRYEQVVQWLGDNPNLIEEAQRQYYQTTAGVLLSVVKASGLSLLGCLAVGGLFGALLFRWRRAHQQAAEAFSDAGGMLRLNLDDITPQSDPAKLLGPGSSV
jgi:uncharacterized protein DUF6599